jgi:hypothetical protein
MLRPVILLLACAALCPAWVESVEFSWNGCPRPLWERQLVWLKTIGITHVSLPPAKDPAQLAEVIAILRRLNLEADLEGPVPPSLQPLTRAHGGPLTDGLSDAPIRISALAPDALARSRKLLVSGKQALIWTDVHDTLNAAGFHPGAVNFAGEESAATGTIRRNALLAKYWSQIFHSLHEIPGAGPRLPAPLISAQQFAGGDGTSFVSAVNGSSKSWTGDLKALYPPLKRLLVLPNITLPAHDSLWLPVNLPLIAGPLCRACTAFATVDHLVYATAEMTSMEYENGILAMEFSAPAAGEVILQLSRQPSGPLVAGGKPADFEWDDHTQRVRLAIPKGTGPGNHVRIGLAIEPPDATAFFDTAKVLLIGETNNLTAEFSSGGIAQRSRLRTLPDMPAVPLPAKDDLRTVFQIKVPETAVPGDHAELALEADGIQMSHSRPQFLPPASIRFPDAIAVKLASNSSLTPIPAIVSVNQRSGREITLSIRNNAPEIRNFQLELEVTGLEFSPPQMSVVIGASASRDVTIRVFATGAPSGLHTGQARLTGAATLTEPIQFVVIPSGGSVAFVSGGVSFLESAKNRAAFIPGRWLEFINKDNGQNLIPAGGIVFHSPVEGLRLQDLESLVPKTKK